MTEDEEKEKFLFCLLLLRRLQIINRDNSANHQRLSRPPYATSELYQIMLLCWKYEPSERPTFSQLEKALADVFQQREFLSSQSFPLVLDRIETSSLERSIDFEISEFIRGISPS